MKNYISTYRNAEYGFEINLPSGWFITSGFSRIPVILANLFNGANILVDFMNTAKENLNIVVEKMQPELPPDLSQMAFTLHAREMGYIDVKFSLITICGRDHTCVTYVMDLKGYLKKYMIVLNGHGYALTASCPLDNRSPEIEEIWDGIATSFQLLNPIDQSVIAYNNSAEAMYLLERLRIEYLNELMR